MAEDLCICKVLVECCLLATQNTEDLHKKREHVFVFFILVGLTEAKHIVLIVTERFIS